MLIMKILNLISVQSWTYLLSTVVGCGQKPEAEIQENDKVNPLFDFS